MRTYVFGMAVADAPGNADSDRVMAKARQELLREVVGESLSSFAACPR